MVGLLATDHRFRDLERCVHRRGRSQWDHWPEAKDEGTPRYGSQRCGNQRTVTAPPDRQARQQPGETDGQEQEARIPNRDAFEAWSGRSRNGLCQSYSGASSPAWRKKSTPICGRRSPSAVQTGAQRTRADRRRSRRSPRARHVPTVDPPGAPLSENSSVTRASRLSPSAHGFGRRAHHWFVRLG